MIRVLLIDSDSEYIQKLGEGLAFKIKEKVHIDIATDGAFIEKLVEDSRGYDVVITARQYMKDAISLCSLGKIFLLYDDVVSDHGNLPGLTFINIYKYEDIKSIVNYIATHIDAHRDNEKRSKKIVFTGTRGGCGTSSTAVAVAECLSKSGEKVLYVDAEYLSMYMFSKGYRTIVIKASDDIDGMTDFMVKNIVNGVYDYIPAVSKGLLYYDQSMEIYIRLIQKIEKYEKYTFVIIDTDHTLGPDKESLLNMADGICLVTDNNINNTQNLEIVRNAFSNSISDKVIEHTFSQKEKDIKHLSWILRGI